MSQGIVYIIIGTDHDFQLAVSLYTLRQHYVGDVAILTDDQRPALRSIARGANANLRQVARPNAKGPALALKAMLHRLSPFTSTVFLDTDTLVRQPLNALFLPDNSQLLRVTPYADWTGLHKQTISRLVAIQNFGLVHPSYVRRLQHLNRPYINVGVFACTPATAIGPDWEATTMGFEVGSSERTGEEAALNMILPDYPHEIWDDSWNCIPILSKRRTDVRIWHLPQGQFGQCPEPGFWETTLNSLWTTNWCEVQTWSRRRLLAALIESKPFGAGVQL